MPAMAAVAHPTTDVPHSGAMPDSTTEPDYVRAQPESAAHLQAISQPLPHTTYEDLYASSPSGGYPAPQPEYIAEESMSPPPMDRGVPTVIALTVGAIALMAVGFLAVAAVLHLLG